MGFLLSLEGAALAGAPGAYSQAFQLLQQACEFGCEYTVWFCVCTHNWDRLIPSIDISFWAAYGLHSYLCVLMVRLHIDKLPVQSLELRMHRPYNATVTACSTNGFIKSRQSCARDR